MLTFLPHKGEQLTALSLDFRQVGRMKIAGYSLEAKKTTNPTTESRLLARVRTGMVVS